MGKKLRSQAGLKVSVVIPTLNEEESIGAVLRSIPQKELEAMGCELEVIVVDGLSTDRTVEIAKAHGARVVLEQRKGYGRAYKTGFQRARGEIIVALDGDLSYPTKDIPELVRKLLAEKLGFISCDRLSLITPAAMSLKHRIGNWILTFTANLLFRLKLRDSQSGMWVFRKKILKALKLHADGMPFSEELKIEAFRALGERAREVSIIYSPRRGEVKLESWRDGTQNLRYLFRKRLAELLRGSK